MSKQYNLSYSCTSIVSYNCITSFSWASRNFGQKFITLFRNHFHFVCSKFNFISTECTISCIWMRNFVQNRFHINTQMMRKIIMFRRNPALGTMYNFFFKSLYLFYVWCNFEFFSKILWLHISQGRRTKTYLLAKVGGPKLTY